MALDKTTLEAAIKTALDTASLNNGVSVANRRQQIATDLATAFDAFVKSGTVTVTVATTGTATAQTGTGTGNIT